VWAALVTGLIILKILLHALSAARAADIRLKDHQTILLRRSSSNEVRLFVGYAWIGLGKQNFKYQQCSAHNDGAIG
jgi:hypothetical protein